MAFGSVDHLDHDAAAAKQAAIESEVVAEAPADADTKFREVTREEFDAAAAVDTDTPVIVRLVDGAEVDGEPVTHCRIAGVVVDPEGVEVTRSVALLLAEDDNVELVSD